MRRQNKARKFSENSNNPPDDRNEAGITFT